MPSLYRKARRSFRLLLTDSRTGIGDIESKRLGPLDRDTQGAAFGVASITFNMRFIRTRYMEVSRALRKRDRPTEDAPRRCSPSTVAAVAPGRR